MASPEFQQRLEEARSYRRNQATELSSSANPRDYLATLREDPKYEEARELTIFDRWEVLAAKVPEFSEEAWEKAGRVFSGINNGVKAALFVDIAQNARPGTYISTDNIVAHFRDLFTGTQLLAALEQNKNTKAQVINYCQQSLSNVGLLTAQYSLAGELIGFGVTEDGLSFGLPHALRLLEWENAINQSAYPILGKTSSPREARAPLTYARILEYLFCHPHNARKTDLLDALDVERATTQTAVENFRALGLVHYKAVTNQTSRVQLEYVWDTTRDLRQAQYIPASHELWGVIISAIEQKGLANLAPRFSIKDIVREFPEEIRRKLNEESLKSMISTILSGLARNGFLQRVDDFSGRKKLSNIDLTQKGRSFAFHIILPTLLNSKTESLTTNLSQLAQTSAELYYPYSTSNKQREQQNNMQRLVQAIGEEPQTAQELAALIKLSKNSINRILRPHIKGSSEVIVELDGQPVIIEIQKIRGVNYYSIKTPQLPILSSSDMGSQ